MCPKIDINVNNNQIELSGPFDINYQQNNSDNTRKILLNFIQIIKSKKSGHFNGKIDIEIEEKNNYIYSTIDDNGIGFSDKNLNKIVKPYFTTKTKGTGLGLSIVNKIINDHDGEIHFKSTSKGARVKIILPKNVN